MTPDLATLREWDAGLRMLGALPDFAERVATLPKTKLERLHYEMEAVKHSRKTRPLAWAELWHRDAPLTSQRESVRLALSDNVRVTFILGGNRSGKSEAGSQLDQGFGLGGDHPDVLAWAALNGLDVDEASYRRGPCVHNIPRGPGLVWIEAPTFADSRRYVRGKHDRLIPAGSKWRSRDADNEAELMLAGGGKLVFKAVNQGRAGHQGDSIRAVSFDEEPNDIDVVNECLIRLTDQNGRMILRMTPLSGWTELLKRYVRDRDAHTAVSWLHGTDNPHVPEHVLRELLGKYSGPERAARERGQIMAMEGRIYDRFDIAVHVTDLDPPVGDQWKRFIACDWGTSVPTCILYFLWNPSTDVVLVVEEWYRAGSITAERAAVIKDMIRRRGPVEFIWADPEDAQVNKDLVLTHDLRVVSAFKAVKYGIGVVATRLAPDANGVPHLLFHRRCTNTLDEIESYVWSGPDVPMKRDDHAMDTLRYGCVGIARTYRVGAQPTGEDKAAA